MATVESHDHSIHKGNNSAPRRRLVIVPVGLIVLAVLFIIGLIMVGIQRLRAGSLTEHSLCSQYNQASTDTQNAVIGNMLFDHRQNSGPQFVDIERISVNAYCDGYPNQPIDGVLNQNP